MDKQANFFDALQALVEPQVRKWAEGNGLRMGDFNPHRNYADTMESQQFGDMQREIARQATLNDPTPKKILMGLHTMLGGKWDPSMDQQAGDLQKGFSEVAPYFMRWSPEWWDKLHGGSGSTASLASAIADTYRYQGIDAPTAVAKADALFKELYADPMLHRGFSAREIGNIYREAARRGLISRDTPPEQLAHHLAPLIGAVSGVRDTLGPQGYDTTDMRGVFDNLEQMRLSSRDRPKWSEVETRIRMGRELQRQGGMMGSVLRHNNMNLEGSGVSLDRLEAQNQQLMQQAQNSPIADMVAATVRMHKGGLIHPGSEAEKFLQNAQSGKLDNSLYPGQWAAMIGRSSSLEPSSAFIMLNQHDSNIRQMTPELTAGVRMSQQAVDHQRYLDYLQKRWGDGTPENSAILEGEQERFVHDRGYDSWQNYQLLQGPAAKNIGNVLADSRARAGVQTNMSGMGWHGPVERTIDAVKGPNPSATSIMHGFLNMMPKPTATTAAPPPGIPPIPKIAADKLPGGKSDNKPDAAFNPQQLAAGIESESEHTDDPDIQKEIAKDHLSEIPDYYTRLEKMEEQAEREGMKQAAQHVLVTGHSGSGKTTLSGQLSQELGMPIYSLDKDPDILAHVKNMKAQNRLFFNWEDEESRLAARKATERALALEQPHVVEGTMLGMNTDLLGPHRKILVDTPPRQIVRQRLNRDRAQGNRGPMPPGSRVARERAAMAKKLIEEMQRGIDSFAEMPDVERMRPKKPVEKVAARYKGLGIPDREDYGDVTQLSPDQLVDLFIQRHNARRAGEHLDYRMGTPETGLYSWAMRPPLPEPGQKRFARQQPVHTHRYGSFQGTIGGSGYGAGTVRQEQKGKLLITHADPNKIEYTVASSGTPERFVLLRPQQWGERDWMLMNVTQTEAVPYQKRHFKKISPEQVEPFIEQMQTGTSVQAKVDGAASLVKLMRGGAEVLSYRVSKKNDRPIVHTERMFGGRPKFDVPKDLVGSVLRGEIYGETSKPGPRQGTRPEGVLAPQELGGVLNATIEHSLKAQQDKGIQLKDMLYDIQQYGKRTIDPEKVPYAERRKLLEEAAKVLPQEHFHVADEVKTPEEAKALWQQVTSGQHPLTAEGVVGHPPTGRPWKAKQMSESDVHINDVFPGEGKYKGYGAGGFTYSLEPGGPVVGKVGTGLSDELRKQMWADPAAYRGRVARIHAQEQHPSGAWRAPALIALHEDYPTALPPI